MSASACTFQPRLATEAVAMLHPDPVTLKEGFALFPSGVVIATALDSEGNAHGFTASSFVPLSIDPPMVLVCLNRKASCHPVFMEADHFAISVLRPPHQPVAMRFATSGVDKFANLALGRTARGLPVLDDALAAFECRAMGHHPGGDHTILTGRVEGVHYSEDRDAMVHFARAFHKVQG